MAEDFAKSVKDQTDIVKIVGEYVKLRKAGAQNWSGLCPFHKEKTGSFSVNAVKQFYYCFGCRASGDVFTFVMKMDSVTFPEAVRAVAAKSGIPLPKREFSSPEEAREAGIRRQLLDLHEAATQYFEAQLKSPGAAKAREYLTGRGVTPETVQKFRIGFAPDDFNDMRDRFKPLFSDEALRASGLFSSQEQDDDGRPTGPLYAKFRRRITFPIANEQGKTIAFTARALEATDDKGRPIAKYMNSPETALYSKGTVLFNLDKAKADMRTGDFALLVEGQMDCISVYMAGIRNVVATSGTAFTEMQVRLLSRFTKNVIVNFDPDDAGRSATEKAISMLTEDGFSVKLVTLEDGLDPDRFLKERGIQAYAAALKQAQRWPDYLIERAREQFGTRTAEAKVKALNFLLPHMQRMPNAIQRDEFVAEAAQKLAIETGTLRQELKQAAAHKLGSVRRPRVEPANEIERALLRALVLPETDPARGLAASALEQHPEWYEGTGAAPLFDALAHMLVPDNPLEAAPDDDSRAMLAEVLHTQAESATEKSPAEQVADALHALEGRYLERRQRELRTAIAEAERRGDHDAVGRLMKEKMEIDRKLRQR
jgi:DNA primase